MIENVSPGTAKPGMILSQPVFSLEGNLLLNERHILTAVDIERLQTLKVPLIAIFGEPDGALPRSAQTETLSGPQKSVLEKHIERTLAMILHHEEVQQIARILIRVQNSRIVGKIS